MGTYVPLSVPVRVGHSAQVITGVILHLQDSLPLLVDMPELPSGADRVVQCTNVRTVDGKRPQFVHDRNSIFVFPLDQVRLIEAPGTSVHTDTSGEGNGASGHASDGGEDGGAAAQNVPDQPDQPEEEPDEEPDEGLLARIREI